MELIVSASKAIKRFGVRNSIWGGIKYIRNLMYYKKFHFDRWHLMPINLRPYALDMAKDISQILEENNINEPIVEIGCGLGEILAKIKCNNEKYGYDVSTEAIQAASQLYRNIKFKQGSFADVELNQVGVLIMVNFIHNISPETLRDLLDEFLSNNATRVIVFDSVVNSDNSKYKYTHTAALLKNQSYRLLRKTKEYEVALGAIRHIEYWINGKEEG